MEDGKLVNLNTNIKGDPIRFYDENPMGPLVNLAAWNLAGNPEIPNPVEVPWDREIGGIMMENNWPYNGPAPFTKYLFLPAMERNLGLNTAALDELMRIIAQAEDFDAEWDAYVAMLNKGYELETITEEVNEAAAEMGISWEPYK